MRIVVFTFKDDRSAFFNRLRKKIACQFYLKPQPLAFGSFTEGRINCETVLQPFGFVYVPFIE